ncbi:Plastocyanin-like [Macleaya cordata]|uniref:Plastocyanin-like n=1 Tax=Macleaya cordata TaxID=56857 RepID=A0A200R0F7_MACCD|nr:Plastocyanin-like [Macleaya cordata]
MANSILRVDDHNRAIFHAFGLFSLVLLMQKVGAVEFKVGGPKGWNGPTRPDELTYNKWAEMKRFQIGDSLLFVYQPGQDSVLQVNKEDYEKCNTAAPIAKFDDGNTSFQLNQSGPHYFISGNEKNCQNNEKMIVIVLADRSKMSPNSNQTTMASPPSPPPSGPIEIIPSPAPVGEESPNSPPPPPSGASSVFVSFISSIGAFIIGSSVILVL